MAVVAVTAIPVAGGHSALATNHLGAPVIGIVERFHPRALADALKYIVAAAAGLTLIAAARLAMLGLSRLAFSLATNRQIPSALGRLHPQRSTPFVLIGIAAVLAGALVVTGDLNFLFGIFAFGSMLAFTIAHVSICVLRYREPDRPRPYRMPGGVRWRGGVLPLPAVAGAVLSGVGWVTVVVLHAGARYVGLSWVFAGIVFFVLYRKREGKPVRARVTVPEAVLRRAPERDFGSILVPLLGGALDDDLVQTAALLVSSESADEAAIDRATIEAIWIFRVPMSLPLDAPLPEPQLKAARAALARAKLVGEEYGGVEVATATVRARRIGQAIIEEARRRGVEAIVLAADESSRSRPGGSLLGGRALVGESTVSETIRYVVDRARCRVILTAPARNPTPAPAAAPDQ
jgi:APA family basic amino acid/polyamine antiporter